MSKSDKELQIKNIACRIQERMDDLEVSKPKLAQLTGASSQSIYQWLSGNTRPSPKYIGILANSLSTSSYWIEYGCTCEKVCNCKSRLAPPKSSKESSYRLSDASQLQSTTLSLALISFSQKLSHARIENDFSLFNGVNPDSLQKVHEEFGRVLTRSLDMICIGNELAIFSKHLVRKNLTAFCLSTFEYLKAQGIESSVKPELLADMYTKELAQKHFATYNINTKNLFS